ncbi:NADH-quinone oxidoreductase subunit NuoH [bacterium]|nr:NADH-quinone oxidoreductase subunit NuoH [bacterium]
MHNYFLNLRATFVDNKWPLSLWHGLVLMAKLSIVFLIVILVGAYSTWTERKILAYMQDRLGPTRVGRFGLLQPLADGIKLLQKECIVPLGADRNFHYWAPVLVFVPALLGAVIVPFGRLPDGTPLMVMDLNVGLLYFLSLGAFGVLGIFMASWGSNNKYSAYGGFRAVAQLVSYEIPIAFSVMSVVILSGSLRISEVINRQWSVSTLGGGDATVSVLGLPFAMWFIVPQLLGFIVFFIAGVAETNRPPFDLPEAESELVGGFHTEYTGLRFAFFFLAEYVNIFIFASMTTILYLGGPMGPNIWFLGETLSSITWFCIKIFVIFFTIVWLRGTLPRLRVDQLMSLCWKRLLPLSMLNFFGTAAFVLLVRWYWEPAVNSSIGAIGEPLHASGWMGFIGLLLFVAAAVLAWILFERAARRRKRVNS